MTRLKRGTWVLAEAAQPTQMNAHVYQTPTVCKSTPPLEIFSDLPAGLIRY